MGITLGELGLDIGDFVAFAEAVKNGVEALPAPADRKPSDFMHLGAAILSAGAPLADKLSEQAKS